MAKFTHEFNAEVTVKAVRREAGTTVTAFITTEYGVGKKKRTVTVEAPASAISEARRAEVDALLDKIAQEAAPIMAPHGLAAAQTAQAVALRNRED